MTNLAVILLCAAVLVTLVGFRIWLRRNDELLLTAIAQLAQVQALLERLLEAEHRR